MDVVAVLVQPAPQQGQLIGIVLEDGDAHGCAPFPVNDTAMAEFTPPEEASMRVALLGGGTIARLVLQHVRGGEFPGMEIVALAGRNGSSRGRALAREFGVPYVSSRAALVAARPAAVVEAASHDAVREHLVALLAAGVGGVGLSVGGAARERFGSAPQAAARRPRGAAYGPCGGTGRVRLLQERG